MTKASQLSTDIPSNLTVFSRSNQSHIQLAKELYFSWYGPRDAIEALASQHGIHVTYGIINSIFHSLRTASFPKFDRTLAQAEYKKISHIFQQEAEKANTSSPL